MTMRPTAATLAAVLLVPLLLSPAAAREQNDAAIPDPITAGCRVRLWAPQIVRGRIEGTVASTDAASLVVDTGGHVLRVSRRAITRLDVGEGRGRQAVRGTMIGAGIGLLGLASGAPGIFYSGLVYGAGIGALVKGDRWREVPLDRVRTGTPAATDRPADDPPSAGS
jgi:hypothetical protein